jgi:peptidoglycan-associated lipoprotein
MSPAAMTNFVKVARAGALAGLLALAASCTTTKLEAPTPDITNAPAEGFQNVQPGSEEDFILNVGRRTYFTESSAALDETAKVTLNNQIAFLKKYPRWYVKIQGFADDPGGDAKMVALSKQRADAVMNYLAAGGINPARMWNKGYGREEVVRACTERACKVQNRRVITNLRDTREEPEGE